MKKTLLQKAGPTVKKKAKGKAKKKANHNRHSNYDVYHLACPNYPNCDEVGCGR